MKLTEGTGPDGTINQIGQIVIDWVCMVAHYVYCTPIIFKYDQFQHIKRLQLLLFFVSCLA